MRFHTQLIELLRGRVAIYQLFGLDDDISPGQITSFPARRTAGNHSYVERNYDGAEQKGLGCAMDAQAPTRPVKWSAAFSPMNHPHLNNYNTKMG